MDFNSLSLGWKFDHGSSSQVEPWYWPVLTDTRPTSLPSYKSLLGWKLIVCGSLRRLFCIVRD